MALSYSVTAQTNESSKSEQDSLKVNLLNEAVVSGTRFKVPVEKSGKTIYRITEQQLQHNAGKTIVDVLNEVPGVQMEGNFGSPGTNVSVYQRGGRNKNTLILIDGVPLNDPSGINASHDLRLLPISAIESVEVLNGGLSTLYGTGASAGVISIKLKSSYKNELNASIDANYGSYNTLTTNGNVRGKAGKLDYMLYANYSVSDGFSSALDENDQDFDDDGFDQKNVLLKLGYDFSNKFKLDFVTGYDDFVTDYDDGAFTDGENVQKGEMFRVGITPTFKYDKGELVFKTLFIQNEREFISAYPTAYKGKNIQLDLSNKHKFDNRFTALWGINSQTLSYKQEDGLDYDDTKFDILDPYASLFYDNKGLNIHAGARINTHSEYDTELVYNINPSYLFNLSEKSKLKVLGSISTSYITPTGYQLYSIYGNTDLKPEKSKNYEIGASYYLGEKFTFNVVYFERKEKDAIDFVSLYDNDGNWIGGIYDNLDTERDLVGVELDLTYNLNKNYSLSAYYSFTEADDPTTFYRIPKNKFGVTIDINATENTLLSVKYNFTGKRTIFDFGSFSEIELADYGLLDIYAQHLFLDGKLNIYGAVNNLLDKDFVSVYGFTTRGINFNIGLNYNI